VPLKELRWQWTYADVLKALAILDMDSDYDIAMEGIQKDPE